MSNFTFFSDFDKKAESSTWNPSLQQIGSKSRFKKCRLSYFALNKLLDVVELDGLEFVLVLPSAQCLQGGGSVIKIL